jgi:hypothetical protein
LYSGAKAVGKEQLKTFSDVITDILIKEPEQPVDAILKNSFNKGRGNIEEKSEKINLSGLALKRKRKPKRAQSQGKRKKVKGIITGK